MIDKVLVWQRVGGKPPLLLKIIKQFLDFYPAQLRTLQEAEAARDGQALHRGGHRLRGAAANFEALGVVRITAELEASALAGRWEEVRLQMLQLSSELDQVGAELQELSAEALHTLG